MSCHSGANCPCTGSHVMCLIGQINALLRARDALVDIAHKLADGEFPPSAVAVHKKIDSLAKVGRP